MLLHYLNRADRKQDTHCHNVIAKVGSIYGLGAASFPPLDSAKASERVR